MENERRINSIDIARLIAAILVIAIHTQAITWFANRANGNIQILTRLAVPFFFCSSGYFLQKGYVRTGCSSIALSLRKTLCLYIILSVVYFGVVFLQNPSLLHEPKKWMLIDFLFNGSYYHLWYLLGVMYSVALIFLLYKLQLSQLLFPLAVTLYIIGLLGTSYYAIGSKLPGLCILFDSSFFQTIRRVFLMGYPFTVLGWTIAEGKILVSLSNKRIVRMTILTSLLFVAEIILVTITDISRTIVITVFLYPLILLIFRMCLLHPLTAQIRTASVCKSIADFTYFWHPIIISVLRKYIHGRFPLFLATMEVCLLLGFGYHKVIKRKRNSHEHISSI